MSCQKCKMLFDQDCEAEECKEQRRRNRQALFDYMKCKEIEAMEEWTDGT